MNEIKYTLTRHYELRHMAGEDVLMPRSSFLTDDSYRPQIINEVPAYVIRQLERSPLDLKEITDRILSEYDVDRALAEWEISDILTVLKKAGVIRTASSLTDHMT